MTRNVVISLCDLTGNMVRPWAEAGYECWCVDVQHSVRKDRHECGKCGAGWMDGKKRPCNCDYAGFFGGIIHYVWGDVRSWRLPKAAKGRIAIGFAFPPCTELTCTGARDFKKKAGWMLADAVQLFDSAESVFSYGDFPYMLENPATSRLNTHRRKPDYVFHPWEYAGYLSDIETDNTCKKTGLWIGGGLVIPEKRPAPAPHRQDCWMASPGDGRANERSETPMGFARAVFLANHKLESLKAA